MNILGHLRLIFLQEDSHDKEKKLGIFLKGKGIFYFRLCKYNNIFRKSKNSMKIFFDYFRLIFLQENS